MDRNTRIIYVMGVSGCGKSTLGKKLAEALTLPFFEGDDYHPKENIAKMTQGRPLNDEDREPWLRALNALSVKHAISGAVITCSALKRKYREILEAGLTPKPVWVYLSGSYDLISDRIKQRKGHFMPETLLQSQFDALEVPDDAIEIPVTLTPERMVIMVLKKLEEIKKAP